MKISLKALFAFSTLAAFAAMPVVRADNAATASAPTPASATAQATDQKAAHQHQDKHLDALATELGLTNDQKAKIASIMDGSKGRIAVLRNAAALSDDECKAKSREIKHEARAQIRGLLTADQQQKFDAMKKAHGKDKSQQKGAGENA